MNKQVYDVPIRIKSTPRGKKFYYLNLNGYRNWVFHLSNTLKKVFRDEVEDTMTKLKPVKNPIRMNIKIFYITKRLFDLDNIGTVISKFNNDALVHYNIIEDDNYQHVTEITFQFGGVDKDNPRAEITLIEE